MGALKDYDYTSSIHEIILLPLYSYASHGPNGGKRLDKYPFLIKCWYRYQNTRKAIKMVKLGTSAKKEERGFGHNPDFRFL